jgi:hypothetical protein
MIAQARGGENSETRKPINPKGADEMPKMTYVP